jgi:putative ABC transport system permease protein
MTVFKQMASITVMNLRSIPQRLGTSFVIVIGIAGVVGVLLSVLAMSAGLMKTISNTGRPDRAIVLRGGANAEISSALSREQAQTILDAPGVKHGADGKPIGSADTLTLIEIPTESGASWANLTIRGVSPKISELRPEMKIVQGRMYRPAVHEIIVGSKAASQFETLKIGRTLQFSNGEWEIVGVFQTGDRRESEAYADGETLMSAIGRNGYQPVTVLLQSPESFTQFKEALTTNPTLSVDVKRESDFFAEQGKPLARVLAVVAYVVGGIMAVGALFGALNTMYSAVSARALEIATLRALGFGATSVVTSVFAEALALSLFGAVIGCIAAYLFFDGNVINSSVGGGGISQLVFALTLTPALIALGIIWACVIGLIGGLFPAMRAARLPVAQALRAV